MSVRMRHTRSHTRNRRSHHALLQIAAVETETGTLRLPHRVDERTGTYRGKQIAPAKKVKVVHAERKGLSTEATHTHTHDHAHAEHANAEALASKGVKGKIATGGRPKARSGMGGQAS